MTKTEFHRGTEASACTRAAWSRAGAGLVLAIGLVAGHPALADSTVYRCGPKGSQQYSQLPCDDASEPVVIKEQHKLIDPGSDAAVPGGEKARQDGESGEPDAVSNAEAFIQQLEKQRSEQLAEIDRNMAKLRAKGAAPGETGGSELEIEETEALLTSLQNTRDSIVSEYDAMIRAAQEQVARP